MKTHTFVVCIMIFMGALCAGCRSASAPGEVKIRLHDQPELPFRYSLTPIESVVVWHFTDDPGGHLRISWSGHEGNSFDFPLTREALEDVVKTKRVHVEFDGGTSKTLPVTISDNKYSRNERLSAFRP